MSARAKPLVRYRRQRQRLSAGLDTVRIDRRAPGRGRRHSEARFGQHRRHQCFAHRPAGPCADHAAWRCRRRARRQADRRRTLFSSLEAAIAGRRRVPGTPLSSVAGLGRQGRGDLLSSPVLLAIVWPVGPCVAGATWGAMALVFRMSSLASLTAAALTPLWLLLLHQAIAARLWLSLGMFVLILVRHDANIRRLLRGEEPRIGAKRPEAA